MATKQQSVSDQRREKGNKLYREVTEGLSPTLQARRLQEAINNYSRALNTATQDVERSSACKNLGMANWKMAKAQTDNEASSSNITFYFKGALSHFQDAKDYGRGRDGAWLDSLTDAATRCWFDVRQRVEEWEPEQRMRELQYLVEYVIDDTTKAWDYMDIANHYFYSSVTALGKRDYQKCLTLLKECHFPLNEARKFGRQDDRLVRECELLEEDAYTQHCVAQSIQERVKGEELLEYVIHDEEVLNIDMVWEIVDSLHWAAQLTRDRDLEMEAMALSALGKVFDKVLKQKDRAKACLMKTLELANSMVPRKFTGDEWYEFARSTVERYQQEQVKAAEDKHEKEREDVLKLLKEELDVLKKKHQELSKLQFLKFVYSTHPPKNSQHKLGEVSATPEWKELKKHYQKAVIHYHPDKVQVDEHGKKWKVLCEEITKLFTKHYEFFKGCEPDPYKE